MILMNTFTLLVIFLLQSMICVAETPTEKGLAITIEADKRASGFGDFTAKMEMILRNKDGRESLRRMHIQTMETEDEGDKSLSIFDSPRDVAGTALLTYTHRKGDDDQWLYLPALKRVKRISSRNKSGAFMGSEFSFEDFSSKEVEKYSYKFLGDEILSELDCFVVERYPHDTKNSGYSRIVSWIDKTKYRIWKEVYYDKKDRLLKTLIFSEYHFYIDSIWRAHTMRMVNHQNKKETELHWSSFAFQTNITDHNFTKTSLKRAR